MTKQNAQINNNFQHNLRFWKKKIIKQKFKKRKKKEKGFRVWVPVESCCIAKITKNQVRPLKI